MSLLDPSPWFASSIRTLLKRVAVLEDKILPTTLCLDDLVPAANLFEFNADAPIFVPKVFEEQLANVQFAHLFHYIYHEKKSEGIHTIDADTSDLSFRKFILSADDIETLATDPEFP